MSTGCKVCNTNNIETEQEKEWGWEKVLCHDCAIWYRRLNKAGHLMDFLLNSLEHCDNEEAIEEVNKILDSYDGREEKILDIWLNISIHEKLTQSGETLYNKYLRLTAEKED